MRLSKSLQNTILHRTFRFQKRDYMAVASACLLDISDPTSPSLCLEIELLKLIGDEVRHSVFDLVMNKPKAEMLVWGKAYPPGGEP